MGTLNEASAHRRTADPIIQARKRDSASKAGASGHVREFGGSLFTCNGIIAFRNFVSNSDETEQGLNILLAQGGVCLTDSLNFRVIATLLVIQRQAAGQDEEHLRRKRPLKAELLLCSVMRSGLLVYRDNVFREMGLKFGGRYGSLNQFDEGDSH